MVACVLLRQDADLRRPRTVTVVVKVGRVPLVSAFAHAVTVCQIPRIVDVRSPGAKMNPPTTIAATAKIARSANRRLNRNNSATIATIPVNRDCAHPPSRCPRLRPTRSPLPAATAFAAHDQAANAVAGVHRYLLRTLSSLQCADERSRVHRGNAAERLLLLQPDWRPRSR